jgi:hypothetical protein
MYTIKYTQKIAENQVFQGILKRQVNLKLGEAHFSLNLEFKTK